MEVGISVEESVAADSPPSFPQPSSNMQAVATDKILRYYAAYNLFFLDYAYLMLVPNMTIAYSMLGV